MLLYQYKESRIIKNLVNMTPPRETNKAPITDPKEMDTYEQSNKKFRILPLRKFSKLQEHM